MHILYIASSIKGYPTNGNNSTDENADRKIWKNLKYSINRDGPQE